MSEIGKYTNVLSSFVELFSTNHCLATISSHKGGFERDEIADENSSEGAILGEGAGRAMKSDLTELFALAKARSSIHLNTKQAACIEAVIDSVYENRGLIDISHEQVAAEYLPIFGELKIAELNRARVFLMHQGPVLGLASKNVQEFKWVISRHFVAGDFNRDCEPQNRRLAASFNLLMKAGKELLPMLAELCRQIYLEDKAVRRLSVAKVKRLLKCGDIEATHLCVIYESLPDAPMA